MSKFWPSKNVGYLSFHNERQVIHTREYGLIRDILPAKDVFDIDGVLKDKSTPYVPFVYK